MKLLSPIPFVVLYKFQEVSDSSSYVSTDTCGKWQVLLIYFIITLYSGEYRTRKQGFFRWRNWVWVYCLEFYPFRS